MKAIIMMTNRFVRYNMICALLLDQYLIPNGDRLTKHGVYWHRDWQNFAVSIVSTVWVFT